MVIKSHPDKLLVNHLGGVSRNIYKLIEEKEVNPSLFPKKDLLEVGYLIGIFHDFGKCTSFFQKRLETKMKSKLSHHGLISALLAYLIIKEKYGMDLAILGYMVIRRHHGNLESPLESIENHQNELEKQLKDMKKKERLKKIINIYKKLNEDLNLEFYLDKLEELIDELEEFTDEIDAYLFEEEYENEKAIERFLFCNFLYSVLIDSDKKDAAGVDNKYFENNLQNKVVVKEYIDKLRRKKSKEFSMEIPINRLRTEFYDNVISNYKKEKNFIYTISAPTGIGKTFTAYGLANEISNDSINGKRIIYGLPFTSIIDQNYDVIEKILENSLGKKYEDKSKYLIKHHYLSILEMESNENKNDDEIVPKFNYNQEKLLLESWESANVVTTFVQVFHSIFSNKNNMLRKFHNIVNSVVILDEIQSIKYGYYNLVGKVFEVFANIFETNIILLTATQPRLIEESKRISLVDEEYFFKNEEFNRVELSLMEELEEIGIDEFIDSFGKKFNSNSALIITNKIKLAIEMYRELEREYGDEYEVYSLTTNILPKYRTVLIKEIKKKINNGEKIIVVSTQLVEAGVDFSFEEVYRDLAPLESIVQAGGRSNRNNELKDKKGKLYLFNLIHNKKDSSDIYPTGIINLTKETIDKDYIEAKDFYDYTNRYFEGIDIKNESRNILNGIKYLNYSKFYNSKQKEEPISSFQLIDEVVSKTGVIISPNENIDKTIDRLKQLIENNKGMKIISDEDLREVESLKKELRKYTINVYKNKLIKYRDIVDDILGSNVIYSKYYNVVYDEKIGFMDDNEEKVPTMMDF